MHSHRPRPKKSLHYQSKQRQRYHRDTKDLSPNPHQHQTNQPTNSKRLIPSHQPKITPTQKHQIQNRIRTPVQSTSTTQHQPRYHQLISAIPHQRINHNPKEPPYHPCQTRRHVHHSEPRSNQQLNRKLPTPTLHHHHPIEEHEQLETRAAHPN